MHLHGPIGIAAVLLASLGPPAGAGIDGSTSTTLIDTSTTVTSINVTSTSFESTSSTIDGGSTTTSTLPGTVSAHDALFVLEGSLSNLSEIESGQLASDAAQSPDVQAYGAQMVADHCLHLLDLEDAADAAGIPIPRALDVTICDTGSPDGAFTTPSADFDATYVRGQISGHRKTLDLYKRQAKVGTDEVLRSLAEATIPELKDHLKQAKRLSRALRRQSNGTSNGGAGGRGPIYVSPPSGG